jgi:antitoxin component YwqK of YwqJK toxin-antitoxin module
MLLRTLAFLLLLGIPLSSFSQNDGDSLKPTKYYYENGQVSSEGLLRNGKPDGFWKSYYRNGSLKAEGNRSNYELDGAWTFYDRETNKTAEISYQNGKKQGASKVFKEGVLYKIDLFEADLQQGVSLFYYEQGALQKEVPFVDGKQSGNGFEYALTDGRITTLLTFQNGKLIRKQRVNRIDLQEQKQGLWVSYHKNRAIAKEGPYSNDLKNGYWKYYKPNGNLLRVEKWINGELQEGATEVAKVDVKREIDPITGKVIFKGAFQNGKATGVHREYNTEGEVIAAAVYDQGVKLFEGIIDDEGRKQGPWKRFYADGSIKATGSYKNNLKEGKWRYFFLEGKLEQQGNYVGGKPNGFWEWFFKDGQLHREEEYSFGLEEGISTEYNDTGAVIATGTYIDGMKEGAWVYTINDHKEEGVYFEGLRNGVWSHYYLENGQKSFEGTFENGQKTGIHIHYYFDGQVKRRGYYSVDLRNGIWEFFDKNGNRTVTIEYEDGEEIKYNGEKINYGRRYSKALAEEKARENIEEDQD